jgi:S1-C subfamily serine protease
VAKDGLRHGQGTYTYTDGTVEEGIWENGEFKYAQKTPYSSNPSLLQVAFNDLSQLQRKQLQSVLLDLGFYNASIDGIYGRRTSAALTEYNNQHLNGSDLTNSDNVRRLLASILSVTIEEPAPSVANEAKPQDDEILEAASGSGFAVSSDGYVITNNHVIEGCQEVAIYHGGRAVPVTVITYDLQNDLALLKGDFTPRTVFALSGDQPELLQDIYVAGYPFGNEVSSSIKVTKGIISSLAGIGNNFSNIQIDAALQVGNSGGPILDEMGNIVGVAVSKLDARYMYENFGTIPENTNFGIKANVVRNILDSNGVSSPSPNRSEITRTELGSLITGGTYYVSCLMTLAQIERLRTEKVMFENLD